ncbi:antirestriction protein [Sphingobium sp.]|uniref:antirestriction protein n=1 Tax=Sphingobium sp. TaxID=1912891 RepID=UPI0028BF3565|nr:antirestriction protein [Sphingobium sp.]
MSDIAANAAFCAASLVPDERRINFIPTLFGRRHFFRGEMLLYTFMQSLSPDYSGGYWQFFEVGHQPLYLAPNGRDRFQIRCGSNGYDGEVSADAAGIIATLFTFSYLSFEFDDDDDHIAEAFHRLRDHALDHPEAAEIFSAID